MQPFYHKIEKAYFPYVDFNPCICIIHFSICTNLRSSPDAYLYGNLKPHLKSKTFACVVANMKIASNRMLQKNKSQKALNPKCL